MFPMYSMEEKCEWRCSSGHTLKFAMAPQSSETFHLHLLFSVTMSKSEIAKDRLNIISNTLARFDKDVKVEEVVGTGSNTLNEKTLLLHVLLEVICRKCEPDVRKRQRLFRKMLRTITNDQMAGQHVNLEALNSVRFVLATKFEKKLTRENLKMQSSSLQSHLHNPEMKSKEKDSSEEHYKYLLEFEEISVIGRGGFGTVCKAMHIIDSITYAVKKIKFKYKSDSDFEKVIREVKSFATLNHLNVVGYNNAWFETVSASASRNSAESEASNSSSPSEESSKLDSQKYSMGSKSDFSRSSTSYDHSTHSESFKRYTFSEKSDDCVTFRDTLSNGSYGDISRTTAKRSDFYLSNKQNFSSDVNITFETSNSVSNCSINKTKSKICSKKFESRSSKLQTVNAVLYIQMEYCDGVLRDWLEEREKGNPSAFRLTIAEIFRDILNGVAHIHSKSIIHRDLKPQNIFYSSANNTMKIGDFGLATLSNSLQQTGELSMEHSSGCGTIPYAAPEQRSKRKYNSKVDMYSLGVILIELLIDAKTRMEFSNTINNILQNEIPEKLTKDWPEYVCLVKNLVQMDPEQRLSAKEVLSQPPIFSNIVVEQKFKIKELTEALAKKELELREKDKRIKELEAQLCQQILVQDKYS